jgi:hypothetical protein
MTVRAKFKCLTIIDTTFDMDYKKREITFMAAYSNEGDNADYSKYTPSGELKIQIDPETKAYDFFVPGEHYYLDFAKAD